MIDTSIWIEVNEDMQFKEALTRLARKNEILTCDTIDQEVEDAYRLLAEKDISKADALKFSYNSFQKISVMGSVAELASEYSQEGEKLDLPVQKMKADLAIVAYASIGNVEVVLTLNRKTMASDYAKIVYLLVNSKKKVTTPHFITEKDAIKKLALI